MRWAGSATLTHLNEKVRENGPVEGETIIGG